MVSFLKKIDLDEMFAYETFKTVIVRDRRLGFLHYFFMLAIFIYIVWSIAANQLYLRKDPIVGGAIRSSAYPPTSFESSYGYCTSGISCMYLGAADVASILDSSIFISTRVTLTNATLNCPPNTFTSSQCIPIFDKRLSQSNYVAGIENYTIMIEHSVNSFSTKQAVSNAQLKGNLLNTKGDLIRMYLPTNFSDSEKASAVSEAGASKVVVRDLGVPGDVLSVYDLMNAAGVENLDLPQANNSIRFDGAMLVIVITYSNRMSSYDSIKYSYQVGFIQGAESKFVQNVWISGGTVLQEWNRHGLQFKFIQTGFMGQFEFMALLQSLVASLALLGVAKLLVEQLMLRALKERKVYKEYKFEITEDFSDRSAKQAQQPPAEKRTMSAASDSCTTTLDSNQNV